MGAPSDPQESAGLAADEARSAAAAGGSGKAAARGRYRDALRHRDLRLLITSFLVDQIGSWSYLIVISVYVFDRTHSTQWLAALAVCRWGPGLLLASYGGVIADRYERVTVLIASSVASAVLMTGMAVVVAVDAPVSLVLVLSALAAAALAPYRPAAGALTPEIVGEQNLAAANSIFSALENLVVVVGPGIGGLLLLTGRPVIGVAVNAASFVIAAAVIARLRVRSTGGAAADGNALQQLAVGLKALAAQPVALAIILFCALDSAVYGASTVLYVPLSIQLGTGPNGYSYLLAGAALGGVLGAGLANRLSAAARLAPVIMGSICLQALPFLATVLVRSPALACALQAASGVGMIIVDVLAITSLQRDLPADVLSRVLGIFDTIVLGGILLASLATGILLAHADVNVALIAIGAGIPAIGLVGLPTLLRADRASAAVARRLRPRVELLSALDLLAGADRRTLERLAAAAEEVVLPAGHVVIREGDDPDALWILVRGELSVHARGNGASPPRLPPVTAPGYVGEIGLLRGIPRTATVRTRQECALLRIDGQEFLSALQASRPSASLLSAAGTRMARTQSIGVRPQSSTST
jgi:CRP-like cAMP-binding protein/predicted MFS family arabinose efflux permease